MPIKIVLIEPDATDVAWTRKLVESCSVRAELADAREAVLDAPVLRPLRWPPDRS